MYDTYQASLAFDTSSYGPQPRVELWRIVHQNPNPVVSYDLRVMPALSNHFLSNHFHLDYQEKESTRVALTLTYDQLFQRKKVEN